LFDKFQIRILQEG